MQLSPAHAANNCHRGGIVMTREIASLGKCKFRISNIHQNCRRGQKQQSLSFTSNKINLHITKQRFVFLSNQSNLHIIVSLSQFSPHPEHNIHFVGRGEVGLLPGDIKEILQVLVSVHLSLH